MDRNGIKITISPSLGLAHAGEGWIEIPGEGLPDAPFRPMLAALACPNTGSPEGFKHGRGWPLKALPVSAPTWEAVLAGAELEWHEHQAALAKRAAREAEAAAYRRAEAEKESARRAAKRAELLAALADLEALADEALIDADLPTWFDYLSAEEAARAEAVESRRSALRRARSARIDAEEAARLRDSLVRAGATEEQLERHDAGVLPERERDKLLADHAFAPWDSFARYEPIVDADIEHNVGCHGEAKFTAYAAPEQSWTAEQWAVLKALRAVSPDAEVLPRKHSGWCESDRCSGLCRRFGARVTVHVPGAGSLSREFALPEG